MKGVILKKTYRKKLSRKMKKSHKKTKKNRKIRGGYHITEIEINPPEKIGIWPLQKNKTYKQIMFTEEDKILIIAKHNELKKSHTNNTVSSTQIRDELFPDIPPDAKENAASEIQSVLGRGYSGR